VVAHRPGGEPATLRSRSRRPTIEPPRHAHARMWYLSVLHLYFQVITALSMPSGKTAHHWLLWKATTNRPGRRPQTSWLDNIREAVHGDWKDEELLYRKWSVLNCSRRDSDGEALGLPIWQYKVQCKSFTFVPKPHFRSPLVLHAFSATHRFIHERNEFDESYLPLPSQPKLVFMLQFS